MPDREKIVDRVRKLLALSKSSNTNEAANAAAAAAGLMARYQIESVEEEPEPDPIGDNRDLNVEIGKGKRPITWKWNLSWVVASSSQCKPYMLHRLVDDEIVALSVAFIGRRSDAEACAYVFRYLMEQLQDLHRSRRPKAGTRVQQYVPGTPPPIVDAEYRRRWSRDFYIGAVATLSDRMTIAREEVFDGAYDPHGFEPSVPSSTALARLDQIAAQVDETAADLGLQYVNARQVDIRNQQGYAAGVMAGREMNLIDPNGSDDALQLPSAPKKP